jgi:hypothetical protein
MLLRRRLRVTARRGPIVGARVTNGSCSSAASLSDLEQGLTTSFSVWHLGRPKRPKPTRGQTWPEVCSLPETPGFRGRRGARPVPFGRRETVPDDLPRPRMPAPVVGGQAGYRRPATRGARWRASRGRPEDRARPPSRGPARLRLGALTTVLRPPSHGRRQARAPRPPAAPTATPASLEGASAAGRGGSERTP